ncbi:hypothetical protein R3P38DRAFT_3368302 [Favolaschia claudopus]|uniref:Uncharacterized protein n=1 Tax=Favolaschia claudopus TaxID=2862362 RepID=A0AAW0A5D1_9AGAR
MGACGAFGGNEEAWVTVGIFLAPPIPSLNKRVECSADSFSSFFPRRTRRPTFTPTLTLPDNNDTIRAETRPRSGHNGLSAQRSAVAPRLPPLSLDHFAQLHLHRAHSPMPTTRPTVATYRKEVLGNALPSPLLHPPRIPLPRRRRQTHSSRRILVSPPFRALSPPSFRSEFHPQPRPRAPVSAAVSLDTLNDVVGAGHADSLKIALEVRIKINALRRGPPRHLQDLRRRRRRLGATRADSLGIPRWSQNKKLKSSRVEKKVAGERHGRVIDARGCALRRKANGTVGVGGGASETRQHQVDTAENVVILNEILVFNLRGESSVTHEEHEVNEDVTSRTLQASLHFNSIQRESNRLARIEQTRNLRIDSETWEAKDEENEPNERNGVPVDLKIKLNY